jgi:hypothetical protein
VVEKILINSHCCCRGIIIEAILGSMPVYVNTRAVNNATTILLFVISGLETSFIGSPSP